MRALLLVAITAAVAHRIAKRMTAGDDDSDEVRRVAIFGGTQLESGASALRSAGALAVLGGIEIDLRHADLDPSGATLDLIAMLGGIQVTVPSGWTVDVEIGGRYGGVDNRLAESSERPADAPVLRINANTWLGGIELRQG
jgi:predicted membrane protein